jgi:hypothetical protein
MALSLATPFAKADNKEINLVFAGNMPDISVDMPVNYPQLADILENQRAKKLPTLFAFAGGSLGPSPLASLDRGSHIIDILNSLEPDLMTLTKREFSYFEDELTLRTYEAAFPIVTTNLYDPMLNANLEGILSNLMIEKDNIKIGFIAVLDFGYFVQVLVLHAAGWLPCFGVAGEAAGGIVGVLLAGGVACAAVELVSGVVVAGDLVADLFFQDVAGGIVGVFFVPEAGGE